MSELDLTPPPGSPQAGRLPVDLVVEHLALREAELGDLTAAYRTLALAALARLHTVTRQLTRASRTVVDLRRALDRVTGREAA